MMGEKEKDAERALAYEGAFFVRVYRMREILNPGDLGRGIMRKKGYLLILGGKCLLVVACFVAGYF